MPWRALTKSAPSGSIGEKVEAKVWGARPGEAWSTGKVLSKGGTLNRPQTARVAEHPILRSRKRQKSGGSEGPGQNSTSEYGLHVHYRSTFPFLTFNRSQDPEERRKKNEDKEEKGGQKVDG